MKDIIESWRRFLAESSLSRLYRHMVEHDTAILTGFRDDVDDLSKCTDRSVEPGIPNKRRNRDMKAVLLSQGFGVTHVDGSYIENFQTPQAVEVAEDSLFVVNLTDAGNFNKTIISLGERYCQDSVLLIPKGGEGAKLYGTNKSEFPGYGNTVDVGDVDFGRESEFMTKVRGRPMTFTESALLETYARKTRQERQAIRNIAKGFILEDEGSHEV